MPDDRLLINVSAQDYEKTSQALNTILRNLEAMVHGQDEYVITDSEFAFGWHFYVVAVNRSLIRRLAEQMGPEYEKIRGKGEDKKFLTWLNDRMSPHKFRVKLALKEEMESSKYGLF